MRFNKLYCTCGVNVGEMKFSHIDPKLKSFDDGKVYQNEYNGNEARDKDGALIPLRYGRYQCKKCQHEETQDLRTWIATYTEDRGVTTSTIKITGKTYTQAYLAASIKINGMVIDLSEVKS